MHEHRSRKTTKEKLRNLWFIVAVIILPASLQNFHWENFCKSKAIREIRENFPPRKYPAIRYAIMKSGFRNPIQHGYNFCKIWKLVFVFVQLIY